MIGVCLYMRATGHALNLLLTRGDGFALGSVLAVLQEMTRSRGPAFRAALVLSCRIALLAGLAVILPYIVMGHATGAVRVYDDIGRYGNWTVNVLAAALLFFGVIGLMSNGQLRPLRRWMSIRPLTWLGEVSYAVYMFQSLIFVVMHQLARSFTGISHVVFELAAIVISIAVGPLSRRFLEEPIGNLKRHFPIVTSTGTTQDAISDPDGTSAGNADSRRS